LRRYPLSSSIDRVDEQNRSFLPMASGVLYCVALKQRGHIAVCPGQKGRCAIGQILHVNIPTQAGHLEGILKPEEENVSPRYTALVCHPHPLGGGTMHNKVVFKVAQILQTLGMPALRFNFRGVGHSTGIYDEGRGEMDDVRFALEFLSHRYPGLPVVLAGFSFGSWVGLRVGCNDDRVQALVGLGTPARMFGREYLLGCHKPKLFIHGTHDELAPFDLTSQCFERLPAPKSMIPVNGADHFFQNRLDEVQEMISTFIIETLLQEDF
jgi:alpha/beta superfamily hydrolase